MKNSQKFLPKIWNFYQFKDIIRFSKNFKGAK